MYVEAIFLFATFNSSIITDTHLYFSCIFNLFTLISFHFRSFCFYCIHKPRSHSTNKSPTTGSSHVNKKVLRADSEDENSKAKPRGRRNVDDQVKYETTLTYYGDLYHRDGDVIFFLYSFEQRKRSDHCFIHSLSFLMFLK